MKNDLGVDCISRDAVKYYIQAHIHEIITESGIDKNAHTNEVLRALLNGVATMPSVIPQEPPIVPIAEIKLYDEDKLKELANKTVLTVTPQEPKTGHWKVVSDGYSDNACICECSECKDTVWVYKDADRKWNYCPNCGAKMVEPQESEG